MDLNSSRLVVLGPNGMLGQVVCRHFAPLVGKIIPFKHRFSQADSGNTVRELAAINPDIVINCAGAIKQRTNNDSELLYANALLPLELASLLPTHTHLIHPSTDCVFNGKSPIPYPEHQPSDAEDVYGWSKFLGEEALRSRPFTIIPRVSIIGPDERQGGPGLLNWFLRQPNGATLNGYTHHHWNGITTLEWCQQIEYQLRSGGNFIPNHGIRLQLGTADSISKHNLLLAFAKHFNKSVTIVPQSPGDPVHRVLQPQIICPPIEQQLEQLSSWLNSQT
jgi:dTDP-4-dehydrorhamnose reductase